MIVPQTFYCDWTGTALDSKTGIEGRFRLVYDAEGRAGDEIVEKPEDEDEFHLSQKGAIRVISYLARDVLTRNQIARLMEELRAARFLHARGKGVL